MVILVIYSIAPLAGRYMHKCIIPIMIIPGHPGNLDLFFYVLFEDFACLSLGKLSGFNPDKVSDEVVMG